MEKNNVHSTENGNPKLWKPITPFRKQRNTFIQKCRKVSYNLNKWEVKARSLSLINSESYSSTEVYNNNVYSTENENTK